MEEGLTKAEGGYVGLTKWGKKGSITTWRRMVTDGKDIAVYKCKSCGYLESYASQ